MIAYTFYEFDNRVRRYAEALAGRGDHVEVVALKSRTDPCREILNGVHVYRIQKRAGYEKYKLQYLIKLLWFLVLSSWFVTKRHLKERYDLLHIHSVPDFEVFSAVVPKLMNAKIILDIHDILPEFYASKFGISKTSAIVKALLFIEKISIAFSDHTIIANHLWEEKLLSRSVTSRKCTVFLNYPDPALYHPREVNKDSSKLIFIYPGSLNWHQGLDIAIRAFSRISIEMQHAEFHIYGEGSGKKDLEKLIERLGMEKRILMKDVVSMDYIGDIMAGADIGVIPKRNDSFGGEAFSTKIFEFMAIGIPVIVAATTVDKFYFNDSVVHFFEPGNENDLSRAMAQLGKNRAMQETLSANALKFVSGYSWDIKKQDYFSLIDTLTSRNSAVQN